MPSYCHSIKVVDLVKEAPFSLTKNLESWGDRLLKPMQKTWGGRCYTIHVSPDASQLRVSSEEALDFSPTLLNKMRALVGYSFKCLAALFNKEIKMRYLFVEEKEEAKKEAYMRTIIKANAPPSVKEKEVRGEGRTQDLNLECCDACCQTCSLCCPS